MACMCILLNCYQPIPGDVIVTLATDAMTIGATIDIVMTDAMMIDAMMIGAMTDVGAMEEIALHPDTGRSFSEPV